jgi:hypothetical protein
MPQKKSGLLSHARPLDKGAAAPRQKASAAEESAPATTRGGQTLLGANDHGQCVWREKSPAGNNTIASRTLLLWVNFEIKNPTASLPRRALLQGARSPKK